MPAHVSDSPQSLGQRLVQPLIGLFFGLLLGGFGVFFFQAQTAPPVLNPVAAYCHGVTDGMVHAAEMNRELLAMAGIPITGGDPNVSDEQCRKVVGDPDRELFEWLRGPLLP